MLPWPLSYTRFVHPSQRDPRRATHLCAVTIPRSLGNEPRGPQGERRARLLASGLRTNRSLTLLVLGSWGPNKIAQLPLAGSDNGENPIPEPKYTFLSRRGCSCCGHLPSPKGGCARCPVSSPSRATGTCFFLNQAVVDSTSKEECFPQIEPGSGTRPNLNDETDKGQNARAADFA